MPLCKAEDDAVKPATVKTPVFVRFNIVVLLFLTCKGLFVSPRITCPAFRAPKVPVEAVRSPLRVTLPDVSTEKFVVEILSTV